MKSLLLLLILPFSIATVLGLDLINPLFRLEEMTKQEGLVVDARYRGRSSCGNKVVLKIGDENITYKGFMRDDVVDILRASSKIGEPITVWSHPEYTLCGKVSRIAHIQYKENIIVQEYDYEDRLKNRESLNAGFWFKVSWVIIITSLMYIWFSYPSQNKLDKNKGDK